VKRQGSKRSIFPSQVSSRYMLNRLLEPLGPSNLVELKMQHSDKISGHVQAHPEPDDVVAWSGCNIARDIVEG
jgi:hypothetical protein